ncbi:MAG: hypothetical protein IJD46_01080 [Bacilli bacterium]|nr:hypothetical protein [Bacilli bacterium]
MSLSTNGFRVFSRAKQEKNEFISFTIKDEDSTVNANLNEINFNILSSEVLRIEDTKIGKYS